MNVGLVVGLRWYGGGYGKMLNNIVADCDKKTLITYPCRSYRVKKQVMDSP